MPANANLGAGILARLLGDFPVARFLDEFHFRLPFPRPGGAAGVAPRIDGDRLRRMIEAPHADCLLSRRGQLAEVPNPPRFEECRRRYEQGHTITIRGAETLDPDLARLAEEFHAEFRAPVNIHVYCTPAGEHGFGWHYDAEDVFVLHTEGAKVYSLRKNTVNPWPVLETMPRDLKFEEEGSPVFTCRLEAGDWLYVPAGWWHIARTETESKSLAVGLMSATALDLYRFLGPRLAASVIWRQRLPVAAGSDPDRLRQMCRDLGRDLAMVLSDPRLAEEFFRSLDNS